MAFEKLPLYKKDPYTIFLTFFTFISLLLFIVYPIYSILEYGLTKGGLAGFYEVLMKERFRRIILNTFFVATLITISTISLGFVTAYLTTYLNIPGRKFFSAVIKLPLMTPTIVISLSFITIFGRNGMITRLIGFQIFDIYGWKGILIASTFVFLPMSHLLISSVLANIDQSLEYAANSLGARDFRALRTIVFPLAMPGIANAALLIFIESMANFGIPLVLGGNFRVLSVEIYSQALGRYRIDVAAFLAALLLLPSISFLILQMYLLSKRGYTTVTGAPTAVEPKKVRGLMKWVPSSILVFVAGIILIIYGSIIINAFNVAPGLDFEFTFDNFRFMIQQATRALRNSFLVAAIAVPLCSLVGITTAYLISRRKFSGEGAMNFFSMMPIGIPGVVIGIGYILGFNKPPLLLVGTYLILVINIAFRELPFAVRTGVASLQQIDVTIEQASLSLGAGSITTYRRVALPLLAKAFMASATYTFIRCMTTFSAIIFIAPIGWKLFPIYILESIETLSLGNASALSTTLIFFILLTFLLETIITKIIGKEEWAFYL